MATHAQLTLLRQIAQGRRPVAQVRLASTSWWHGDLSVTRDMNAMRKSKLIRMWRDAARNQHMEITDAGLELIGVDRKDVLLRSK